MFGSDAVPITSSENAANQPETDLGRWHSDDYWSLDHHVSYSPVRRDDTSEENRKSGRYIAMVARDPDPFRSRAMDRVDSSVSPGFAGTLEQKLETERCVV